MTAPIPPTTDELRAAFERAKVLHFRGWTFERALQVPYMLTSMCRAALVRRESEHTPAQPGLF